MNTRSCPGAKQRSIGDQAILPSQKGKAALGAGSRQQAAHRTPKKAIHIYVRNSGLLQTCWFPSDPRWVKVSNEREAAQLLPRLFNHSWTWYMVESMEKKRQGAPSQRSYQPAPEAVLPALVSTPQPGPTKKAEWTRKVTLEMSS